MNTSIKVDEDLWKYYLSTRKFEEEKDAEIIHSIMHEEEIKLSRNENYYLKNRIEYFSDVKKYIESKNIQIQIDMNLLRKKYNIYKKINSRKALFAKTQYMWKLQQLNNHIYVLHTYDIMDYEWRYFIRFYNKIEKNYLNKFKKKNNTKCVIM